MKIVDIKYNFEKVILNVIFEDGHIEVYKGQEAKKMFESLRE